MTQSTIKNTLFDKELSRHSTGTLVNALEKLGKIDEGFDFVSLKKLLKHSSESVRALAIKNLAKSKDIDFFEAFVSVYKNDTSTVVKREAISAIGRQKKIDNSVFLLSVLCDSDPKIVCQAIRALLACTISQKALQNRWYCNLHKIIWIICIRC